MPSLESVIDDLPPRSEPVLSRWSQNLRGIKYLAVVGLLAIGYRLLINLTYFFPLPSNLPVYPIWPPAAYNQLILLLLGLKFWPAIALGSLLNSLLSPGADIAYSLVSPLNSSLTALIGVWPLFRYSFSPKIDRFRDMWLLVLFAGMISAAFGATFGSITIYLQNSFNLQAFGFFWFNWFLGNFAAVIVIVPTVLTIPEWPSEFKTLKRKLLGIASFIGYAILCWFIFATPVQVIAPVELLFFTFPLLVWGALGFGSPGLTIGVLLTACFAAWGIVQNTGPFVYLSEAPEENILNYQGYLCALVMGDLALTASMAEQKKARQIIESEQKKSEQLLLNILPQPIALRLKKKQGAIADYFADVTVLFADIVDFTPLSAEVSPQELVVILNDIFSTFDDLAEKHGLEKIKTIGDAYMVVGGLPEYRDDHALAMAEMALDMKTAVLTFSQKYERPFNIRIGINTGPVVAGVIGRKKFIYDLWGDTVNIASRMESAGIAGEIQVTPNTYDALKHCYHFECRGEIPVKGKGTMATYLIRNRLAVSTTPGR